MSTPELEQALAYLTDNAPGVPGHVSTVAETAAGYLAAVQAFAAALGKRRESVAAIFDPLKEALAAFQEQADEADRGLGDLMTDTEAARQSALDALAEGRQAVETAIGEAEQALTSLKTNTAAIGERATRASEETEAAAAALASTVADAESGLEFQLDSAITRTGTLAKAIAATQSAISEPVAAATRKIAALAPDAETHIADVDARIARLIASLPSLYEKPIGELNEAANAVAAEYGQISQDFREELGALVQEIDTGRETVATTVGEPLAAWAASRDLVAAEAAAMETNRQPLPDGVQSVRAAAAETGVAFGT